MRCSTLRDRSTPAFVPRPGEIIRETAGLLRSEATRHNISVRTELAANLPQIVGDRVQLQQVAMNLIVNSLEAMKDVDGIRELAIKSQRDENEQLLVTEREVFALVVAGLLNK